VADSWAFNAGTDTFTLTLDGSGTDTVSRSRTFTGLEVSQLYTFYLTVTQSDVAVQAFLEVEGGDTALAEGTASQTLMARGETDVSGEIVVRFGVQEAGAVGSVTDSDDLDYASIGLLHAAGWAKTDTVTSGGFFTATATTDVSSAQTQGGNSKSLLVSFEGYTSNFRNIYERRVFSGYTPGQDVTARVWCYAEMAFPAAGETGLRLQGDTAAGGAATPYVQSGQEDGWVELYLTDQADGSGNVTVDLGVFQIGAGLNPLRTIYFSDLELTDLGTGGGTATFASLGSCVGTGLGDDSTNVGGDPDTPGDEPIPDPPPGGWPEPPVGGTRWFGIHDIPAEGLAFWNSTVKAATTGNVVNLVNAATTAGTNIMIRFGPEADWLQGGRFYYPNWEAKADAMFNDTRAKAAIDAGIAAGSVWLWGIDEPFHLTRYGPGGIPFATVERMYIKLKTYWPTARTIIRVDPSDERLPRAISGVDTMWAEYNLKRGEINAFKSSRLAAASALDVDLVFGIHYFDFAGPGSRTYITPAQLRHYGGILADTSATVAMGGWKYSSTLFNQTGFRDAVQYVRDLYASRDP
jgi:hypothetical protein